MAPNISCFDDFQLVEEAMLTSQSAQVCRFRQTKKPKNAPFLQYRCGFKVAPLNARTDSHLLLNGAVEEWAEVVSIVANSALCTKEGITDGEWYGLIDDDDKIVDNFDICAACRAGWFMSIDRTDMFRKVEYPPGTTRVCDFNPSSVRYDAYISKWNQMYYTYDNSKCLWSILPLCDPYFIHAFSRESPSAIAPLLPCSLGRQC